MRSSRNLAALALALVLALVACGSEGDDDDDTGPSACEESILSYDNFGDPFMRNWCTGCHSSDLAEGMRQDAPTNVNFDSREGILLWRDRIELRALDQGTMPPTAGPGDGEKALLREWLSCGARP